MSKLPVAPKRSKPVTASSRAQWRFFPTCNLSFFPHPFRHFLSYSLYSYPVYSCMEWFARLDPEWTSWLFLGTGPLHHSADEILIFFFDAFFDRMYFHRQKQFSCCSLLNRPTHSSKHLEPISCIAPLRITWGGNDLA